MSPRTRAALVGVREVVRRTLITLFTVLAFLLLGSSWPTGATSQRWPERLIEATSGMAPIDLSDGSWTVYDPATRVQTAPSLIAGTWKNKIDQTYGTAGTAISGMVVYYRAIGTVRNIERVHRINVSWASRLENSAAHRHILAAGYINGDPSVAGTVVRLYGLQQADAAGTQITGRLTTTAGAGTWSTAATAANPARAVQVLYQAASIEGAIQMTPAMDADGHGSTTDTVVNTYTFSEDRSFGSGSTLYEAIAFGSATAGGDADFYIAGESGFPSALDGRYHYSPEVGGGGVHNVYVDADSEWIGGPSGGGINAGGASGVQRAWQEFELRQDPQNPDREPVRFVGYTGSPMAIAVHRFELDGQVDTGALSGRTLQTAATQAAARVANVVAAGRTPRTWLVLLGINDAQAGRTKAQMDTDLATEAAAVKAGSASTLVKVACIYSANATYIAWCDDLLDGSLPANVDGVIDLRSWWSSAFAVSGVDGHPELTDSPTALDGWNGPFGMDPDAADYTQCGACAFAYHVWKDLRGTPPPLLSGEVAPL